ncbi:MAG: DNA cytosine methyltransferase [Candidatus Moranbacteria bacterium]|nr:DNA cytosine methyltransferase [Candidatus Moranbacteria bacterium]
MKIASFFTGAGGLDLGFEKAGFEVTWANEFDKTIWKTFEHNFPHTKLDKRSIVNIPSSDVPDSFGIVGGPPCQSWSEAGAGRGINDSRGKLFFEYIRILKEKEPLFFLAENVSGILSARHKDAFESILKEFKSLNYNVTYHLLNANDFNVPQDRKRVIIVGYHKKMNTTFQPPKEINPKPILKNAIWDLRLAKPTKEKNYANDPAELQCENHEYMTGDFSTMYMSRNRVRSWNEPSFTIQAGGRHAPIHPQAPKMKFIEQNKRIFLPGKEKLYRRLTVRECARIQTFPDHFSFKYDRVADGYKMIGNAVPVEFAKNLANVIYKDVLNYLKPTIKVFEIKKEKVNAI